MLITSKLQLSMKIRALLVAVITCGSLVITPVNASAFLFGSYCIKLSSSEVNWQAPKSGGSEFFRFRFTNTCQKVISSFQVDISEDISGGSFSQWNTLGGIYTLQDVNPGQQGIAQISIDYIPYVTARDKNKIYLRSVESEVTQTSGITNTTNNVTVQQILFTSATKSSTLSSSESSNNGVLARGIYSETANDDGSPISSYDVVGNIRKINVTHNSKGTLLVVIDYWKVPNSNFTTRIRWCAPEAYDDYDGKGICDATNPNWLNYLMFFSPSTASKGSQAGVRKSFKGTSKKGKSSNQIIYTISGPSLKSDSVGVVEVLMLYSSSTFTERTTTCRGGYTITCNTRSSNIFERDAADVKLEQM